MADIKTRFAPSPTGFLHAGNYRTAVFSYLVAKQLGGKFALRIEDTDRVRSKKEYEENIVESLEWLGLQWDEFSRQSDNVAAHREAITTLVTNGAAYVSKEAARDGEGKREIIRFKNPKGSVSFKDIIRGEVVINMDDLGDFVIAKSFDEPTFHLAVVVDDANSGVTHIIRGEDHISNTPRQILIQRALGIDTPKYAHLPLILAADRTKLSKRKGARALTEYRDMGILPEAMLNYLALLGWHPKDDKEFFLRDELVESFSLQRVQKGGAIFDDTKLLSINRHWMRTLPDDVYLQRGNLTAPDMERVHKALPILKERASSFKEAHEMLDEMSFLFTDVSLTKETLIAKESETGQETTKTHLQECLDIIEEFSENVSTPEIRDALMPYADKIGRGAVLWPLRYALSGKGRSPDPFTLIYILGKNESVQRIKQALATLKM